MAASFNRAIILGNLTRDPEVRRSGNGDPIVNIRIATNESWRDKQTGERREKVEYHNVVIFNEGIAKVAEQYLAKGSKVLIEGQLQTRKWTDRDNNERYTTEIVLQKFRGELTLLGDGGGGGDRDRGRDRDDDRGRSHDRRDSRPRDDGPSRPGSAPARGGNNDLDDDIPF